MSISLSLDLFLLFALTILLRNLVIPFLNIITNVIKTASMPITIIVCPDDHFKTPLPKRDKEKVEGILAILAKKKKIPKGRFTIPAM